MTRYTLSCLCLAWLFLASCTSEPLNNKYDASGTYKGLYDEKGERVIDSVSMALIVRAATENTVNGTSNDGLTYRELLDQGTALAVQERAAAKNDSMDYMSEREQRMKAKRSSN